MLKLFKSYIVVVHLLLLFHIAHTFVLLTANVDDVKKIARTFVSDELAEKIADFIARATETLSQQQAPKTSEENIINNSQVSAENTLYNVDRHGFDGSLKVEENSKGENAVQNKVKTLTEKNDLFEPDDADSKPKPRKETKGKSRYIIESDQVFTTTDKADGKGNEVDHYDKLKEDSIKMIENNLLGATDKAKITKSKQKKKAKVKPYKLLSTYNSDKVNAVKYQTESKEKKEDEEKRSQRAFDDEIAAIRNAALEYDNDVNEKTTKPLLVKDESDKYDDETTKKREKVIKSNFLAIGKNEKEDKWWEKDLPKHNQDADSNSKHKTWF